jgi:hypothetical protein
LALAATVILPPGLLVPPLAVNGKRGLACILGERSFIVDLEAFDEDEG